MDFNKIKSAIASILDQAKGKASTIKDKAQLKRMISQAIEDGVLSEEEENQIVEAVQALSMDPESVMADVNEKLSKIKFRIDHVDAINQHVAELLLVDGQVQSEDYDAICALAQEIDLKEEKVEDQILAAHGPRCLMAVKKTQLETLIASSCEDEKISDIEFMRIRKFAYEYGYRDSEIFALIAAILNR